MSNQLFDSGPFAKQITDELQAAVDNFNNAFAEWNKKHLCNAELGWNYRDGKALEIREITLPVYKKPLPQAIDPGFIKMNDVKKPE